MDDRKLDELLSGSLRHGTESAARTKEMIWENIEQALFDGGVNHQEKEGQQMITRVAARRKKRSFGKIIAAAVAAVVIVAAGLTVSTETGQAYVSKIRQMFVAEKKVVDEIEGSKEQTDMQLNENESSAPHESDYVIYIDKERYTASVKDGVQRIEAKTNGGDVPDVYMEISQVQDRAPADIAKELQAEWTAKYASISGADVSEVSEVTEPVKGYKFRALAGQEWNSEKVVYYVVSNEVGGSFVIKQSYFLEASEGHGARMDNMLRQFQVVPGDEGSK